jgi:tetratricopeptide (TPR) repeat protein
LRHHHRELQAQTADEAVAAYRAHGFTSIAVGRGTSYVVIFSATQSMNGGKLMVTKNIFATLIAAPILCALLLLTTATALAQTPTTAGVRFYTQRGHERHAQGKWQQAIADFDRALAIEPRNAALFNARGLTWLALKDYGLAVRDFNQALKLAPDCAMAYAHRGLARLRQGREAKAAADFARGFALDESLRAYVAEMSSNGQQRLTMRR